MKFPHMRIPSQGLKFISRIKAGKKMNFRSRLDVWKVHSRYGLDIEIFSIFRLDIERPSSIYRPYLESTF